MVSSIFLELSRVPVSLVARCSDNAQLLAKSSWTVDTRESRESVSRFAMLDTHISSNAQGTSVCG